MELEAAFSCSVRESMVKEAIDAYFDIQEHSVICWKRSRLVLKAYWMSIPSCASSCNSSRAMAGLTPDTDEPLLCCSVRIPTVIESPLRERPIHGNVAPLPRRSHPCHRQPVSRDSHQGREPRLIVSSRRGDPTSGTVLLCVLLGAGHKRTDCLKKHVSVLLNTIQAVAFMQDVSLSYWIELKQGM